MQTLKSHPAAVLVLLAVVSAAVKPAWSQTYPTRPVKLVTQGAARGAAAAAPDGGDLDLHRDARDVPQPAVQH
jgi:hypothetical protein